MGWLLTGFRKNEQGIVVSKTFDSDVLLHGSARQQGWYDSPDKIPDAEKLQAQEDARRAANATKVGQRAGGVQVVHGDYQPKRGAGQPR
jgi:hypothetical protein